MPGIVVFRRRWMVASDDFVIPFFIAFVVRGIWFLILGVSLAVHHGMKHTHWSSATEEHLCQQTIDYFVGGYVALLFATNIMEVSIAWMSGKGSIMDTEPRSLIPSLLYVRLMLTMIEIVWLSVGIKWIWIDTRVCFMTSEINIAKAVVVFSWMFLFIVGIIVFCTFDTAGQTWFAMQQAEHSGNYCVDSADGSHHKYKLHITQKYQRRWQGCFRYAFCCRGDGQGDENVYVFIGRTLSEYFQDLDVVPSDFASGLVLLRRHQKYQEKQELERALDERRIQETTTDGVPLKKSSLRYQRTNNAQVLRLNVKEELLQYKEIAYYMNYALAAYGWPIYMKNNVMCGCCKLGASFRCCNCCRPMDKRLHKSVSVEDDNCCRCHFSAMKKIASLHNSDVIYCSYHNSMYKSPFYVALDHHKKAVVITIRGTLSLQDILTDFTVEPERIPVEDGDPSWYGHKGMVRCALYIQKKLVNEGILQRAFNADPDCGTPNYHLIVLGHSLGAGTAAILAFLLRPQYPDLFCYAYSPPGANLSLSAAKYARDFVISVVVGKDMIPRLSLFTLEDLRNNIMTLISKSRMSKWRILRGCACRCAFACCYGCKCIKFDSEHDDVDAEIENIEIPEITHSNSMRFYPPGRILHVVKTCSVTHGFGRTETMFEPVWAGLEEFQSIKISGLMWKDHMPDFVLEALNKCLPSREQEESVLSAPDRPRPAILEVPNNDWYGRATIYSSPRDSLSFRSTDVDEFAVEIPNVRVHQPAEVMSKNLSDSGSRDSIQIEIHQGRKEISTCLRTTADSPLIPLARPESSIDDSDVEESATSSRISTTWKDFNLPIVEQSLDSLNFSRTCAVPFSPEVAKSLTSSPTTREHYFDQFFSTSNIPISATTTTFINPPPKPPRTFETERSWEWSPFGTNTSVNTVDRTLTPAVPQKPPRTFVHDSVSYSACDSISYSPYDWSSRPNKNFFSDGNILRAPPGQDFVDAVQPIVENTSYLSHPSTVTHLQDKSCLTLCNGFDDRIGNPSPSVEYPTHYSRSFSDDKISFPDNQLQMDHKSFSLVTNPDVYRGLIGGPAESSSDEKVVIRRAGRGNKNRNKRRAIYLDSDERANMLQFSCSCSDIPDRSVLDTSTRELDSGLLEPLLR